MGSSDLLLICISAFTAVFVLLLVLALVMRALIAVFPERVAAMSDAAMFAAITAAVTATFPGARISKIEETQ